MCVRACGCVFEYTPTRLSLFAKLSLSRFSLFAITFLKWIHNAHKNMYCIY